MMSPSPVHHLTFSLPYLAQWGANLLILVSAYFISIQMRLTLPVGASLGSEYPLTQPWGPALITASALLAYGSSSLLSRWTHVLAPQRQFRHLLLTLCILNGLILLMVPEFSQLQLLYLSSTAAFMGLLLIVLPGRIYRSAPFNFVEEMRMLWQHRFLIGIWFSFNIKSRYSQTILGIFWIVLLPLSTSAILAFAFSNFLRIEREVPIFSFFFSGLVAFNLFSNTVFTGMRSLSNNIDLINQINFPKEILPILSLLEGLVDFFFTFLALILLNLIFAIFPNPFFAFLPIPLLALVCLSLGISFFTSTLSLLVRDVPQLVTIVLQLLLYISPVLYSLTDVPGQFQPLVRLNPIANLIEAFREIILFQRMPDLLLLPVPVVSSFVVLYLGYRFFKYNVRSIADML